MGYRASQKDHGVQGAHNRIPIICLYARIAEMRRLKAENSGLRRLILELTEGSPIELQGARSSGMKIEMKEDNEGKPVGPKQVNMGNRVSWM